MVENRPSKEIDGTLRALASPARRELLERLAEGEASVGALAGPIEMTIAGVSKHLDVLERARLIERQRVGRETLCRLRPDGLTDVLSLIDRYQRMWGKQIEMLDRYLRETSGKR